MEGIRCANQLPYKHPISNVGETGYHIQENEQTCKPTYFTSMHGFCAVSLQMFLLAEFLIFALTAGTYFNQTIKVD